MKILFLDIDGVLNTGNSIKAHYIRNNKKVVYHDDTEFCPISMRNLKSILERTQCNMVLSSTWRMGKDLDDQEIIQREFKKYGIDFDLIIDSTPVLWKERGYEIDTWLSSHPEVSHFVILDDDMDMVMYTDTHLVKCSFHTGITKDIKERAIKILMEKGDNKYYGTK